MITDDPVTQRKPMPKVTTSHVVMALLVHQNTGTNGGTFITRHNVLLSNEESPRIGEGEVLTKQSQNKLIELLSKRSRQQTMNYLPECVLGQEEKSLCWYTRPAVRNMTFRTTQGENHTLLVPWPGLIFFANARESLNVAAFLGNTRPTLETPLYHAPLMNIDGEGDMCFGNIPVPTNASIEKRYVWENALFDTRFTHTNHAETLHEKYSVDGEVDNGILYRFWCDLAKSKTSVFPASALNPFGSDLKKWMELSGH